MKRGEAAWVVVFALCMANCSRTEPERVGADRGMAGRGGGPAYGVNVDDATFKLGDEERTALLKLARASVESFVRTRTIPEAPAELAQKHAHLAAPRACFVTLRQRGELRGCIGSLEPRRPLIEDVRQNAVSAAVHDTRFSPVSREELGTIDYEISVLDLPRVLTGVSAAELPVYLAEHKPGVIIEYRGRRSTFLPTVWEDLPAPLDFLDRLCRKQGSSPECWRDPSAKISVYGSIHFAEKDTPAR